MLVPYESGILRRQGNNRHRHCAPVQPGPGEVQIRVACCGICGTDLHIFHGKMDHRVRMPQVIGHEMAGAIAAVGEGVATGRPATA